MIGYLKGKIKSISDKSLILEVNGVGYRLEVGEANYMEGQDIEFFVHTHVREQELRLFGFKTQEDLEMFTKLIEINGVGPKVALALVSELGLERILQAIDNQNPHALKVPGVGIKTAEKIILELRGKEIRSVKAPLGKLPVEKGVVDEVIVALEGLGYKRYEIEVEIRKINMQDDWASEDIIKELLKRLSGTTRKGF